MLYRYSQGSHEILGTLLVSEENELVYQRGSQACDLRPSRGFALEADFRHVAGKQGAEPEFRCFAVSNRCKGRNQVSY